MAARQNPEIAQIQSNFSARSKGADCIQASREYSRSANVQHLCCCGPIVTAGSRGVHRIGLFFRG